jgi:hypothetical protein
MKNITPQENKIQGLLDRYLRQRASGSSFVLASESHLDDDSLTAFVEGNLSSREARPMVAHLIDCSFCRHVTTELVRLDLAFAETDMVESRAETTEPSRVSEVLSGILSRIFGTNDGAVFAHQENESDEEDAEKEKTEEDETRK